MLITYYILLNVLTWYIEALGCVAWLKILRQQCTKEHHASPGLDFNQFQYKGFTHKVDRNVFDISCCSVLNQSLLSDTALTQPTLSTASVLLLNGSVLARHFYSFLTAGLRPITLHHLFTHNATKPHSWHSVYIKWLHDTAPSFYTVNPCGVEPSSCLLSSENGGIRHSNVLLSWRSILKVPLSTVTHKLISCPIQHKITSLTVLRFLRVC